MQGLPHAGGPWAARCWRACESCSASTACAARWGCSCSLVVGGGHLHLPSLRVWSSLSLAGLRCSAADDQSVGALEASYGDPRGDAGKPEPEPIQLDSRSRGGHITALASSAGRHNHSRSPARPPDKTETTHGRPLRRHRDPEQRRRPVSTPRINQIAARHAIDATPARWHDVTG